MVIGEDTYISLEDANEYLTSHYLATQISAWSALSDADKEKLLLQSAKIIDRQILTGRKASTDQAMAFPRVYFFHEATSTQVEVPEDVGFAQAEIALSLLDADSTSRRKMQADGIKSFSIEGLSETYVSSVSFNELSPTANQILKKYLAGGIRIC